MLNYANLSKIFDLSPTPSVILLPDFPKFTVAGVNASYLKTSKTLRDNLVDKGFFDAFPTASAPDIKTESDLLLQVIHHKIPCQSPIRKYGSNTPDSQAKYFYAVNVPVLNDANEVEFIIRSLTDVTETVTIRKKERIAKNNLREASLLMAQGQELANFGNWQWDIIKNKVSWSKTLYNIYGLDETTFKATFEGYQELLHPGDRERVYNIITGVLNTKQDVVFEERIMRPNGEMRYLKSWGRVQTDESGAPVKMIGACLDITESKLAETKLKEMHHELEEHLKTLAISEKRYSDLFHLSPLPMWVFDLDTLRFLNVNIAAIKHYGYSREEFLSMTVKEVWSDEGVADFEAAMLTSKKTGYTGNIFRHKKKNGDIIQVYIQSNLILFNGKNTYLVLANDITERQNYTTAVEKQNKQLQEIAWIQSHVVRAPLARIMGLIELFKNYEITEINKFELLHNITNSANELDGIIRDISDKTEQILLRS